MKRDYCTFSHKGLSESKVGFLLYTVLGIMKYNLHHFILNKKLQFMKFVSNFSYLSVASTSKQNLLSIVSVSRFVQYFGKKLSPSP